MNFIAQVEEHLRDLGAEARKKHPGVKEASERAILQLRALQNAYVTAVRMATQSGGTHPTTELFRSQDILRPFLLAANYPNASPQLLQISLSAMSLLIEGNAICPGDGIHMVRVWTIQANVYASALRKHGHHQKVATSTTTSSSSWFGMLSSSDLSSSSSGQGVTPPKKESEKVALELLSLLIQLLELRDLPVTDEQWASSVALCCILLETEKSNIVQQAANSTLHQVLSLMFEKESEIAVETWQDLVTLASAHDSALVGAFSHCTGSGPLPPSPQVCLELMHKLLSQEDITWLSLSSTLMDPTLELTKSQFSGTETLETLWRSSQLARILLQKDPRSDLIATLVQGIVAATEACRKNHDFEDGFIYMEPIVKKQSQKIMTLIPDPLLWKAGLALETLLVIMPLLKDDASVVAEAISDFCTIGASCHDHMLQLVECASANEQGELDGIQIEPNMFRNAEEAIKTSGENKTTCSMGEALWLAFHCILRLIQSVGAQSIEGCFAPSLAVLQHYLKRFPGSNTIVQCTLEGYLGLADVAVPVTSGRALLRQALLASLCKLSLPSWGKHDPSCQLDSCHVESLICLLNITHKHYDNILSDWRMILWTFQELSILSISSPLLSDEGYAKALAVSSTFARIAPLSTCLSPESLTCMIDALADISASWLEMRDILMVEDSVSRTMEAAKPRADSLDVKTQRRTPSAVKAVDSIDPKTSLSGKLMSFAGLTLLGSQPHEPLDDDSAHVPVVTERTKNTYFGSYRQDFLQRLLSSKRAMRSDLVGKLPFSLVALTDVALANMYRYDTCGTTISNHFCSLAATSPDIRANAMNILAMLVASQLSDDSPVPSSFSGPGRISVSRPMKNQLLVVEAVATHDSVLGLQGDADATDTGHRQTLSQADLVAPLCETIQTAESNELAEAGISALHSILEGAGHNMTDEVWTVLIVAISSLSGDTSKAPEDCLDRSGSEWATGCMLAFRCLKLIVDDFLDQIPKISDAPLTPRAALLDCCSSFGSSCHDVNISLTAIGLLWSIADQDSNSGTIDRALSKLVVLSCDNRTEVRNCAVNTLFSYIVGRGQGFTGEQWEVCICQTIFGVYDRVLSGGENIGEESTGTSVSTGVGKKSKTASARYKVSVHHSRDSAGKQWTTTQVMVLQGLSRVLRNFFPQLLDTMDSPTDCDISMGHNPVWFPKAWTRILDVAMTAARQSGSRETLELRTVGVELLVQCCQLTCGAGTRAAITPARVGTNMEVVNGALKHLNENTYKATEKETQHQISAEANQWREVFFLAAFDALDAYCDHLEQEVRYDKTDTGKSPYVETTQVQVLHKLALGLDKLYECCKNDEFAPEQTPRTGSQRHQSHSHRTLELDVETVHHQDNLEGRFVNLVAMIARTATGDTGARFLTQAQRAALELLRSMSSQSSDEAIRVLASLGGESFFWIVRNDNGNEAVDDEAASVGSELLSHEAAKAVAEVISTGKITDETKVQVLYRILSIFENEIDENGHVRKKRGKKRCYTLLVPMMESGLCSAARLGNSLNSQTIDDRGSDAEAREEGSNAEADQVEEVQWLDGLWNKVVVVLTQMLSPVCSQSHGPYISRAASLQETLEVVVLHVPPSQHDSIFPVLSSGASTSVEIARFQTAIMNGDLKTAETRRKAETRREEALKIFEACFNGMCSLEPKSPILHDLTKNVLQGALSPDSNAAALSDDYDLRTDVAVIVCQVIARNAEMERLVIAVFSLLCKLMSAENEFLRTEAGILLGRIDVGQVLETATRRCELAEERVQEAEEHIRELVDEIEDLREENDSLQQQILVYATSSALT